ARRLKSIDMDELLGVQSFPPVTLLAPAYNEEPTCVESIRSLLTLRHPAYDIIVVNDGSRDRTLDRLSEAFALQLCARAPMAHLPSKPVRGIYRSAVHPNLWVIDKVNGGKADSLNAGLNYCRTPLFCAIDADSLLEQDSLIRISRPFLEDDRTVAAGGIIRIVNDCEVRSGTVTRIRLPRSLLARFQVLEYLRAFLAGRVGWDALNATLIISGAFGMFRRAAVVEAGGYATDTVGEDMELVVRLRRRGFESGKDHRVAFVPDPVAWTECPETVRVLGRQRDRWQRGLMESIWRHRRMLFNPRYGRVGTLAFPYFFFLEMCGPVIEGAGYLGFVLAVATGRASLPFILAFLALAFAFGMALSVAAVALEELTFRRYPRARDLAQLFWLAILENVGYRQLSTYWRLKGIVSKVRGATGWGAMERRGFKPKPVG
ncbi:MAG: glycosyltransferase family 2 protein, partial [Longimicrobiales bacterium]|nr:glycosyltransferase family 2 protein [Longimicrobiales bacterium]